MADPRFEQRDRTQRASGCSCWQEPGCWGSHGWHFYAVEVPAVIQTRNGKGGVEETYTRPAYLQEVAFERCPPYWLRREEARAAKAAGTA